MTILIIGATGKFAPLIIPELTIRGLVVRALVQDESKITEALERGVTETAIGNLNDPASLLAAAEGAEGVFHINPAFAPDESGMGVAMVQAAEKAGVKKFVFSSVYHPSLSMVNHSAKNPVQEALYDSDMDFTILQPAIFMQNLDSGWPAVVENGRIAMPYSNLAKTSYVDYRDVAEVAAQAFIDESLSFGTFELCSAGMFTREDLARMMSDALNRNVEAVQIGFQEWADQAHIPAGPLRDGLAIMNDYYDKYGFHGGNALVLRTILGREPRTLQQYIRELARFPWPPDPLR